MSALVFGEADPKDYMEPLCGCGHMLSEHYDGNGSGPAWPRRDGDMYPCWSGWEQSTAAFGGEGCQCDDWSAPEPREASK